MDVGWYSALAVAEFDPILSEHRGRLHYSLYGHQHTHALSNRIRCYSIWTMGFTVQTVDKGDRHAVYDVHIDLLNIVVYLRTSFSRLVKMKI
jgi:hypothetical protein